MKKYTTTCQRKNLSGIRSFVEKQLVALIADPVLRNQIIIAIDEACSNAMIHANQCNGNVLEIRWMGNRKEILVEVMDNGSEFNFTQYHQPEINNIISENRKNGLGMILINKIMDEVEFKRRGEQNICRMRKRVGGKEDFL